MKEKLPRTHESQRAKSTCFLERKASPLPGIAAVLTLFMWVFAANTFAATNILRWGDDGPLSRSKCYPSSEFPFAELLPTMDQFPNLLTYTNLQTYDRVILVTQMRTLSRCHFLEFQKQNYGEAFARWHNWWTNYGWKLATELRESGRTYPEAWRMLPHSANQPWAVRFTTAPAGVVLWNEISLRGLRWNDSGKDNHEAVTTNGALLGKILPTSGTRASWVFETWEAPKIEECQPFLASLIYAIDNPWLFKNDSLPIETPAGVQTTAT